jgi:tripeptidyl-peptidase I
MKLQTLLLTVAAALAIPTSEFVLHEERFMEHGLDRGARVGASSVMTFKVALKQDNLEHGYDYLMSISDPNSPKYGKHWSTQEVRQTFHPSNESIETVQKWLLSHAIEGVTLERGYLSFDIPMAKAESVFRARYYEHRDSGAGGIRVGCDEYGLYGLMSSPRY